MVYPLPLQAWTPVADFTHHAHTASLSAVAVSSRFVVTGSKDETIHIYDMKKKLDHGALVHHRGEPLVERQSDRGDLGEQVPVLVSAEIKIRPLCFKVALAFRPLCWFLGMAFRERITFKVNESKAAGFGLGVCQGTGRSGQRDLSAIFSPQLPLSGVPHSSRSPKGR